MTKDSKDKKEDKPLKILLKRTNGKLSIKKSNYITNKNKKKLDEIKEYISDIDPIYKLEPLQLPDKWYSEMTHLDIDKYEIKDCNFNEREYEKIKTKTINKYITLDRILNIKYITLDDKTRLIERLSILRDVENDPYNFIKFRDSLLNDIERYEKTTLEEFTDYKNKQKNRKELDSIIISGDQLEDKIINLNIDQYYKGIIWQKYKKLIRLDHHDGEYYKLKEWIDTVINIPYNKINNVFNEKINTNTNILLDIKNKLDKELYGMQTVKEQLLMIINHKLNNPNASNISLALVGPPGVGKTHLIQILANVLELPFQHISAGSINDSAFLTGHSYTYEGSRPGKIVDALIKMKCKNGIFFFDEIDKLSQSSRGQEITNQFIHISDFTQNHLFIDKYIPEIPIDLSKAWFLFSLNRMEDMNPILRNRMNFIYVNGYSNTDKFNILKNYLIPRLFNDFNLNDKYVFDDELLYHIIKTTTKEEGIRELKRSILTIFKCLELIYSIKKDNNEEVDISFIRKKVNYSFPYQIKKEDVDLFLKKDIPDNFPYSMYI